ncbi:MAG: tetratricopeptide repeat protein, partial [Cyanobacteria bacterium]|nr:tetratricopeptide repeat protein [Cyanobacteriota bacterium]
TDFSTSRNSQDAVVQDAVDIHQTDISVVLPTRPDEVERNFQQEISSALSSQDHVQVFYLMIQLARYRLSLGLLPSAEECLSKALALQQGRTPLALAELYSVYASYYKAVGALEKAVSFLLKAVDVLGDETLFSETQEGGMPLTETGILGEFHATPGSSQGQKRKELMGTVYQELGGLTQAQGQLQESARYYYKAIKFYQESKNPLKQAEVIFKVAEIYDEIGRKDLALTFYEQSLALDKALQNHVSCSVTLANLGTLYLEMGRTPQAIRVLLESLAYDRRTRHWEGLYHSLMLLAKAYKSEKELFMAEDAYLQALAVADQENQTFWQASVYLQLGSLNATMQQWKQALEYYQLAAYNAPEDLSERSKQLIEKKIQEAQTHVNP